ncbi:HDL263Wp [Eremothecium sinecaudum]|uniref:HDL263Wp n=1 Tax=Eremothecium sinecaudum TaxID=45286 RepID=A0A0X8HS72_9SACH|nr:HDL263Wp [Eremothecium sinecaudum]AMD20481.1 HDL263Wp [Eremothecium sinecaudum]
MPSTPTWTGEQSGSSKDSGRNRRRSIAVAQRIASIFSPQPDSESFSGREQARFQKPRRSSTPAIVTPLVYTPMLSPSAVDCTPIDSGGSSAIEDDRTESTPSYSIAYEENNSGGKRYDLDNKWLMNAFMGSHDYCCSGLSASQQYLVDYLTERGFIQPNLLVSNDDVSMYAVTSGKMVFLNNLGTSDDEYLNNLSNLDSSDMEFETRDGTAATDVDDNPEAYRDVCSNGSSAVESLDSDMADGAAPEPVRQFTNHESDRSITSFNIAVVVSINKPVCATPLLARLLSYAWVYWNSGVPPEYRKFEECYITGELEWKLTNENYSLYVPPSLSPEAQIIQNNDISFMPKFFRPKRSTNATEIDRRTFKEQYFKEKLPNKVQRYETGHYVFILPVNFGSDVPETIYVPSGRLHYSFSCGFRTVNMEEVIPVLQEPSSGLKSEDSSPQTKIAGQFMKAVRNHLSIFNPVSQSNALKGLVYGSMPIIVVRTPPLRSVSTADKPIYINRVWNNSLCYEVSLSQKYVPLGSELPLTIKLVPLVKDISLKRLRVNIVERISFVSKSLEYEFDQVDAMLHDPCTPYYRDLQLKRLPYRTLSLLDVRTKGKKPNALNEEMVENAVSENLLAYSNVRDRTNGNLVDVIKPLTIKTKVRFPKFSMITRKTVRKFPPYGIEDFISQDTRCNRSTAAQAVFGFISGRRHSHSLDSRGSMSVPSTASSRETPTYFQSDSSIPVRHTSRANDAKRGLYMDSVTFPNINVKHKLEVVMRISKREPKTGRIKHFEVFVDAPIILVSQHCDAQNIDLPTYDMATKTSLLSSSILPTFEEATMGTSSSRSSNLASLHFSPHSSPTPRTPNEPDDISVLQLSLSRTDSSHEMENTTPSYFSGSFKFSNMDEVLSFSSEESEEGPS